MFAFRGIDQSSPYDAVPQFSSHPTGSYNFNYPRIETVTNNTIIVHLAALNQDGDKSVVSFYTGDMPLTEIHDQIVSIGTGGGIAAAYGVLNTPTYINKTYASTSTLMGAILGTFALRPAPSASVVSGSANLGGQGDITGDGTVVKTQFFIDFDDYTDINDVLTEWTPRWNSTSSTISLVQHSGETCFRHDNSSDTFPFISLNLLDSVTNYEVVFKHLKTGANAKNIAFLASATNNLTVCNYVSVQNFANSSTHYLSETINNNQAENSMKSGIETLVDIWYWVRIKRTNNKFQYKMWQDGTNEPLDWLIDYTFSSMPNGNFNGFSSGSPCTGARYIQCVGVGINGASAPTSASSGPAIVSGAVSLTGQGNMSGTGAVIASGSASLTGQGKMSGTGTRIVSGTASLAGQGAVSGTGTRVVLSATSLTGKGDLSSNGVRVVSGFGSLTGKGDIFGTGTTIISGAASIAGKGDLSGNGIRVTQGAAALTGRGTLSGIGTRVVSGVGVLMGQGTISAAGEVIAGSSVIAGNAALIGSGNLTGSGHSIISGNASLVAQGAITGAGTRVVLGTGVFNGTGSIFSAGYRIISGSASLTGLGALSGTGVRIIPGNGTISGTGVLSGNGERIVVGAVNFNGKGSMSGIGNGVIFDTAIFTGEGTLTSEASGLVAGTAIITGTGALRAAGIKIIPGTAQLTGDGILEGNGMAIILGSADLTGSGTLEGITSASVVMATADLVGAGVLSADGSTAQSTVIATIDENLNLRVLNKIVEGSTMDLSPNGTLTVVHLIESPGLMNLDADGTLTVNQIIEGVV
jgi:hypothetical protein